MMRHYCTPSSSSLSCSGFALIQREIVVRGPVKIVLRRLVLRIVEASDIPKLAQDVAREARKQRLTRAIVVCLEQILIAFLAKRNVQPLAHLHEDAAIFRLLE